MDIGIKSGVDIFTGNVVCDGHYLELMCSLVYRRRDGGVARTLNGTCSEYMGRLQRRHIDHTLHCSISSPIRILAHVHLTLACG